jgi:hypothetical protein
MKKYYRIDKDTDEILGIEETDVIVCTEYIYEEVDDKVDEFKADKEKVFTWNNGLISQDRIKTSNELLYDINSNFENTIYDLTSDVPESEKLTWTKQEAEARAWLEDNSASTPFIDGILSERTKYDKATLVAKIIEKADAYASAVGALTGARQHAEDKLGE